ncbi:hypothetical protein Tco_0557644, partial [Tanacetum coccineum]
MTYYQTRSSRDGDDVEDPSELFRDDPQPCSPGKPRLS